jgi:hypothetical protein
MYRTPDRFHLLGKEMFVVEWGWSLVLMRNVFLTTELHQTLGTR